MNRDDYTEQGATTEVSWAQEGLWLYDQLEPDNALFNLGFRFRLRGQLNVEILRKALSEIVRRHDPLRTRFAMSDGRLLASVIDSCEVPLTFCDCRSSSSDNLPAEMDAAYRAFVGVPFDLAKPPLIRAWLGQCETDNYILGISVHHIVFDGWSKGVFHRELVALYEAYSRGEPAPLEPLPLRFADYAARQRRELAGAGRKRLVDYWRQKLSGAPDSLDLPLDLPRPAVQQHVAGYEHARLDPGVAAAIGGLASQYHAIPFSVMLTTFALVLARWTGQEELLIAAPMADRRLPETQDLIAMLVNVVPLRIDFSETPSFSAALQATSESVFDAFDYGGLPYEVLLRELQVERTEDRAPLCQVALNFIRLPPQPTTRGELAIVREGRETDFSRFDMTLYVLVDNNDYYLTLAFNKGLFSSETAKTFLRRFLNLLQSAVKDPVKPISGLPLLDDEERLQLCSKRNQVQPVQAFSRFEAKEIEQSVGRRFQSQAAVCGNSPAVISSGHTWTYSRLGDEATRIAREIVRQGGCGKQVALLFEPGPWQMAAMLGALLAGACYVPLDSHFPEARLRFLVENAEAELILTERSLVDMAEAISREGRTVIIGDQLTAIPDAPDLPEVSADALAYIIYTSGTTGDPKGVMQNHRNLLHHIRVYTNALHISAEDRLVMLASYTTDAGVMDMYGALLNGATVVQIDLHQVIEGRIVEMIDESGVTVLHTTPTVFRWLMGVVEEEHVFASVRAVVLGGEAVRSHDLDLYRKHFTDDCLFVNGLGPTESTLALQCFFDKQASARCAGRVPVGYPVEDTEVFLADRMGSPTDLSGQIAIRSRHVALGYWKHPELSGEVFKEERNGMRIYYTGDQGRMRDDGKIEFLGRRDDQIKIRGQRVELGEIESALTRHPAVKEAAVNIYLDERSEGWLAAFVVVKPDQPSVAADQLLDTIRNQLPAYMIPSAIEFMEALARTRSGKVNRKELRPPSRQSVAQSVESDLDDLEMALADLWREVIGIDSAFSRNDSFFLVGGDSLHAMRLRARLLDDFDIELKLADMFRHSTLKDMARLIESSV